MKIGVDDLIAAKGPQVLRQLLATAWRFDGRPCPRTVHLSDIEDAALGRKRLAIDVMVSAVGESYLVPKTIELQCIPTEVGRKRPRLHLAADQGERVDEAEASQVGGLIACEHSALVDGRWELDIVSPEILIDLTRTPSRALRRRLQDVAEARCSNARYVRTKAEQAVTAFLATPKARRLRALDVGGRLESVDERGKPFRQKVLYFLGNLSEASRVFRGIGVAIPNPKNQEATAFLWSMMPIADDYEAFEVTEEFATKMVPFHAEHGQVWQTLLDLAQDVTDHIANIYGEHRNLSLLGKLLVFHSVRGFEFGGEMLKRGWLEMLEVGDTGQGKTQQVDRIILATGMGESVDGVSTTRTGLAYSFQKFNEAWFLVWGKYPLNDGKLLFVDEAQNLQPEDIDKIRKGRSDGVIAADGVRSGEHATRTRLIATCNPRFQGVVDDEIFGIELVKQTFKDEDIRRFDFAIISSSSDDKADINQPAKRNGALPKIGSELLAQSVRWAWSRREDQVTFELEATDRVYEVARNLTRIYGEARDIPLVLESDARHKVARIAVAIATFLHSTDSSHERVVVTEEHVRAVETFLKAIYGHRNCSFNLYAKIRRAEADLPDTEYEAIWHSLREFEVDRVHLTGDERGIRISEDDLNVLLRAFVTHGGRIGRQDLAGELGKTAEWTSKIVRVLKSNRLIRVSRGRQGGYQATPKFIKFLKIAIDRKEFVA